MDRIDRDRLFIPAIRGNDCAPLDLRLPAWFGSFSTHGLSHLFRRILAAPSRSPAAARDLVAWGLCEVCLDVEAAPIMLFE